MTTFPQCHFKPETGQALLYWLIYIMKKYKTKNLTIIFFTYRKKYFKEVAELSFLESQSSKGSKAMLLA